MKIVVTGGAGFIGRHLVESFLKSGNTVTIYDNLRNASMYQISHLIEDGASFVKGEITDYKSISKAISGSDSVVHLAAQIDVQESIRHPEVTRHINITGTINLLRACVAHKVCTRHPEPFRADPVHSPQPASSRDTALSSAIWPARWRQGWPL